MTHALASVIIRTKNRPEYLEEALKSVEEQTWPNVEIIIVNDGGKAPLSKHKVISLPVSVGRSRAANFGLNTARGEYICFLDDDDQLYPGHLQVLITALVKNNKEVAYADSLCAAHSSERTAAGFDLKYSVDFTSEKLQIANITPIQCVVFKQTAVRFDPLLDTLEDWDFWLQLNQKSDFMHVRKITSEYRIREDGTNTVGQNRPEWSWSEDYLRRKHSLPVGKVLSEGLVF